MPRASRSASVIASSVVRILPEAGAAERRAQGGVVDRDDPEVAARGVVGQQHLLVAQASIDAKMSMVPSWLSGER